MEEVLKKDTIRITNILYLVLEKNNDSIFQGIGATLLAIVIVIILYFVGVKCVEEYVTQEKFKDAHFTVYISCTNCNSAGRTSFENGTILLGHIRTCGNCGIVGKLNERNTLISIKQKGK